ncbi:hypothetical protein K439DRAFT_1661145 [Ramaria rubella]|nr:hypothetical protein K439DRAFT_1661145 [Ramaria rubella]
MLAKRSNQHKPCPPLEDIGPSIVKYYEMGMADTEILKHLLDRHVDKEKYGLSIKSLKRMHGQLGLQSIRQQNHDLDSALPALQHIRARYPKAGLHDMRLHMLHEEGVKVSRVIEGFFLTYEPEGIKERKACHLKCKRFWAAGVDDIWAIDQHDKWKHFHLWLHTGVEPYSGKILWLRVWWTNKNPKLILHYYLEAVQELGAMPLVTQSDPGSENYGVANDLLEDGVHAGWYDPNDPLDVLLFRWLFIPWLQAELDTWKDSHNAAPKRADKNKILPHGRPQLIFEAPHMYDSLDFKVGITLEAVQQVHEHYAPSDDPVFILVPSAFEQLAESIYHSHGRPSISRKTIWGIFAEMLVTIRDIYASEPTPALEAAAHATVADEGAEESPGIA